MPVHSSSDIRRLVIPTVEESASLKSQDLNSDNLNSKNRMRSVRPPRREDMRGVVIGAGLSGLLFSELIRKHYPSVHLTILDRRGRTGGRVYTSRDRPDQDRIELGAEFVNQDHYTVKKWCNEFGIGLLPTYNSNQESPLMGYIDQGQFRDHYKKNLAKFISSINCDRDAVSQGHKNKEEFDRMSIEQYLDNLNIKGEGREVLNLFLETEQGIHPKQMSVSFVMEFMDFEHIKEEHRSFLAPGDDKYVIEGGSSTLVAALEQKLSNSLELGHLVESVTVSPAGRFKVFAGRRVPYEADFVVFAIPGPAYKNISIFSGVTGLDDLKRKLLSLKYSESEKTIIEVSGAPLPVLTEYNQVLVEEAHGMVWWSGRWRASEKQTSHIAIYRGGENVGRHIYKAAIENVIKGLTTASRRLTNRRIETPRFIDGVTEHWPDGGFSQPKLGRGAEFNRGTALKMGNVFVIGEQMASKDPQTMEGALESAERAFELCAKELFGEAREIRNVASAGL